MTLINANRLSKSFGGRTLFENISFGIDEKARLGLVGPNGAGKSTLLRLLAGAATPDDGVIARKKGLRLGWLEQVPEFPPGQTILQAVLAKATPPADEALPRALALLAQLGLNRFGEDFAVDKLSGGWRKRVALARELLPEPELLLLDEPTNHLDVSGILWLEDFLRAAPFAVLMVTHDRLFLQRTTDHILDLDPRNPNGLLNVRGDYLTYLEAKEHELHAQQRQERVLKNTLRREREWLSRGAQARQTKQNARIDGAARLARSVEDLRVKNRNRRVGLEFSGEGNAPRRLIEAESLGKSFDGRVLFENLDLLITPQTRLALLGDNGCGKSTLVRVLLGLEPATTGSLKRADDLKVAYFEQGRETLDPSLSVRRNVCPEGDYVEFNGRFVHVHGYLERFLFAGEKADLPAARLSGGEQARLRLAQLMLRPCQILVLDEPTNDLDAETLQVLAEALEDFSGAVVLVTHDRYFMDTVAERILAFPPETAGDRVPQAFASYFQWEEWFNSLAESNRRKNQNRPASSSAAAPAGAPRVKLSFNEKYELEKMEERILALEADIGKLEEECHSPAALADHKRLSELHSQLAERQADLDAKYQRWADLEAKSKGQT